MKTLMFCAIVICIGCLSCEDNDVNPDVGFIKANIDGVETIYNTLPEEEDIYNYIRPGSINITFIKNKEAAQYWSISIIHGYAALNVNDLPLPFTIKGPNPDFSGKSPEALMLIIDPNGGPYGKQIAGLSSFDHDFSLTITSIKDNVVKGTFSGIGHGEFTNGEFYARLPVKEW